MSFNITMAQPEFLLKEDKKRTLSKADLSDAPETSSTAGSTIESEGAKRQRATGTHKKRPWSRMEDMKLMEAISLNGACNWDDLAAYLGSRTGKQCRERYHNILDPQVHRGQWTSDEDKKIVDLHKIYGNHWAKIAKVLTGRTDNAIKNRWHVIKNNPPLDTEEEVEMDLYRSLCFLREGKAVTNAIQALAAANVAAAVAAANAAANVNNGYVDVPPI